MRAFGIINAGLADSTEQIVFHGVSIEITFPFPVL